MKVDPERHVVGPVCVTALININFFNHFLTNVVGYILSHFVQFHFFFGVSTSCRSRFQLPERFDILAGVNIKMLMFLRCGTSCLQICAIISQKSADSFFRIDE